MNFDIGIPKKEAYKFNEVTSVTSVKPYVLRFWETEFIGIAPEVLEDGSKLYKQSDIDLIEKVKDLLFNQKMSIPEAKHFLEGSTSEEVIEQTNAAEVKPFSPEIIGQQIKTAESSLEVKSQDLKVALENIINSHSDSPVKEDSNLEQAKKNIVDSSFSDKDVLNLVSAKKKLTGVLSRIDSLTQRYGW